MTHEPSMRETVSPGTEHTPPLQTVCHLAQNTHHHYRLWVTWHTTYTTTTDCVSPGTEHTPLQTVGHLAHNTHPTTTDCVSPGTQHTPHHYRLCVIWHTTHTPLLQTGCSLLPGLEMISTLRMPVLSQRVSCGRQEGDWLD